MGINLRNPAETSIGFISPPSEDKRQKQISRNAFMNNTTSAIDPANYQNGYEGEATIQWRHFCIAWLCNGLRFERRASSS